MKNIELVNNIGIETENNSFLVIAKVSAKVSEIVKIFTISNKDEKIGPWLFALCGLLLKPYSISNTDIADMKNFSL